MKGFKLMSGGLLTFWGSHKIPVPYPALPCPTLPYPALPYPTMLYLSMVSHKTFEVPEEGGRLNRYSHYEPPEGGESTPLQVIVHNESCASEKQGKGPVYPSKIADFGSGWKPRFLFCHTMSSSWPLCLTETTIESTIS